MRAPSGANTHSAASSAAKGKSPIGLAEHATPVRPNNVPQSKLGLNTPEHTPAHPAPVQRTNLPTKPGVVHRQPPTKAERQQLPIPDAANVKRAEATSGSKETDSTVAASPPGPEDDPLLLDSGSHEEYGMNSDDDDFFATVDLGEGDTGIGGHIDFDEGTGGVDLEVSFDQQPSPLEAVKQPRTLAQSSKPLQPAGPGPRIQNAAANMQEKASAGNAASRAGNIPTRTPSMGGFHFPPGYHSKLSQPPAAIAGSKRTADIMQGAGPRRPLQGMGLSHQPIPVPTTGKREPLAQLDVEGGDVKRVRR
ncbi:hypothetical protein BC835DRAFT_901525 [Cytidiella melzeri]|nr:hypothetical protein BC835DRAFT_901525 [Cytidiella melzeri]